MAYTKKYPDVFLSLLLAQKKLSGNGNSNSGSNAVISDDYNFNSSIKELPNFNTPDSSDKYERGLPLSEISAMLARKAKSVYERYLASEEGEMLLAKANEYEIPYDAHDIDIITLRDKVEEFESAIELANQYGIDWQNFGYDLLAIEQEIADAQSAEHEYFNYARRQFLTTRGIVA